MRLRFAAVLLVLFVVLLPVQGQPKTEHSATDQNSPRNTHKPEPQPATTVWNVVNQQTTKDKSNGAEDKPKSYLARLFTAEIAPTTVLCRRNYRNLGSDTYSQVD
jgi:hypothetical protein